MAGRQSVVTRDLTFAGGRSAGIGRSIDDLGLKQGRMALASGQLCRERWHMAQVLAYLAAAVIAAWGVAHAIPTRQVLAGFAPVTADNRRVVLQEWLAEAFTMWGIAAVVTAATVAGGAHGDVSRAVYRVAAVLLMALGALTALTGARTPVVWFKICPVLLAASAGLLLAASLL
jgi:hypothetical protein